MAKNRYLRYEESRGGEGISNPLIDVEMNIGTRKPEPDPDAPNEHEYPPILSPSLSDAEAIHLWDKVLPTLRTRPGAF
ncbi:T6SS immunity protein Tli4 family protein [Herbaspirillum huttiense]|uniref:T6SS immunity protein Tli4 family protein n=1 Tax=Herbaspirillum huttiense TaxID=863372 RepID=UPI003CD098EF